MKKRIKQLIKLGIFTTLALYAVNKYIESHALDQGLLKKKEGHLYTWKQGDIYYKKSGSGSPLLLVHDLHPAASSFEWSEVIDELSKKHTVYAIDLLGCGRSDKPQFTYTAYMYVLLLKDFVQDVIGEKTSVAATGISGAFAAMAASMYDDLFQSITMINPKDLDELKRTPDEKCALLKGLISVPIIGTSIYYILNSQVKTEQYLSDSFYNAFHLHATQIHTYYESAHLEGSAGRFLQASINGNYVNTRVDHILSKISCPIHIIIGNEIYNGEYVADSYQEIHGEITVSYINKTKNLPQLEAPALFSECVEMYLL